MSFAITLLFLGALLLALGSLDATAVRLARLLRGDPYPPNTPYTGPTYSRRGREVRRG